MKFGLWSLILVPVQYRKRRIASTAEKNNVDGSDSKENAVSMPTPPWSARELQTSQTFPSLFQINERANIGSMNSNKTYLTGLPLKNVAKYYS